MAVTVAVKSFWGDDGDGIDAEQIADGDFFGAHKHDYRIADADTCDAIGNIACDAAVVNAYIDGFGIEFVAAIKSGYVGRNPLSNKSD